MYGCSIAIPDKIVMEMLYLLCDWLICDTFTLFIKYIGHNVYDSFPFVFLKPKQSYSTF